MGENGTQTALLSSREVKMETVMGQQVEIDKSVWHWCMVFPQALTDDQKKALGKPMDKVEAVKKAKKYFFKRAFDRGVLAETDFDSVTTVGEFQKIVRRKLLGLITGKLLGCKAEVHKSYDGDELFLKIALDSEETQRIIAQNVDLPMPVHPDLYNKEGVTISVDEEGQELNEFDDLGSGSKVPTISYSGGKFHPSPSSPAYLFYRKEHAEKVQPFRQLDVIRLVKYRLDKFIDAGKMTDHGLIMSFFPLHNWDELAELKGTTWSHFCGIFTCDWYKSTGGVNTDKVRDYYGEEVGFFFHWLMFYSRKLVPIAVLSLLICFRRLPIFGFTLEEKRIFAFVFAGIMLLWSSFFIERYSQESSTKIQQWGMHKWTAVAPVLPSFSMKYRGTLMDEMQKGFHWLLLCAFLFEIVASTTAISRLRTDIAEFEEDNYTIWGVSMPKDMASLIGKVAITANIKIVSATWGAISPSLTIRENWKTDVDRKYASVSKLFVVKVVAAFYPFLYIAFMKKYYEGCTDEEDGCVPELAENLVIFFVSNIFISIASVGMLMFQTWYAVRSEIMSKATDTSKAYTYVEVQAKCPVYREDTDDMMELVINLSFVMLFAPALPVMAFLNLLSNVFTMKLLALRMIHANQRPLPRGQIGIGSWVGILQVVSMLSVICNVALVCFAMHPIEDYSRSKKLAIFLACENLALGAKYVISNCIDDKGLDTVRIEEINQKAVYDLVGEMETPVDVKATEPPVGLDILS